MHYIPNTSLIHDTKIFKSQPVMACNGHVITCHYMHYMPLHVGQDANAFAIQAEIPSA